MTDFQNKQFNPAVQTGLQVEQVQPGGRLVGHGGRHQRPCASRLPSRCRSPPDNVVDSHSQQLRPSPTTSAMRCHGIGVTAGVAFAARFRSTASGRIAGAEANRVFDRRIRPRRCWGPLGCARQALVQRYSSTDAWNRPPCRLPYADCRDTGHHREVGVDHHQRVRVGQAPSEWAWTAGSPRWPSRTRFGYDRAAQCLPSRLCTPRATDRSLVDQRRLVPATHPAVDQ